MTEGSRTPSSDRRSHFATLIRKLHPRPPRLPVVCTVGGPRLRTLVEEDRLAPEPSPHGREPAVFLSYGRPVMQAYTGLIEPSRSYFSPVVLIFDSDLIDGAARVFPFDSAAWTHGGMAPESWRTRALDEFDLTGIKDAPSRIVHTFYGTNFNYLTNRAAPDRILTKKRFFPLDTYAVWLAKLDPNDEPLPNAVEIQYREPVTLSTHLRAIIAPTYYLADRIISDFLIAFNVATYAYSFYGGRSSTYPALIDRLLMEHMKTLGVVHHD